MGSHQLPGDLHEEDATAPRFRRGGLVAFALNLSPSLFEMVVQGKEFLTDNGGTAEIFPTYKGQLAKIRDLS